MCNSLALVTSESATRQIKLHKIWFIVVILNCYLHDSKCSFPLLSLISDLILNEKLSWTLCWYYFIFRLIFRI